MTTKTVQAHPHAIAAREERRAEALAMGIDEPFIADLVDRFYAAVREDAMLGPVFDARVDDWPKHLGQMNRFWQRSEEHTSELQALMRNSSADVRLKKTNENHQQNNDI